MIRANDICSLSDFRQNAKAHLDRLAESGGAEVLTVNGQAKGVVMSPDTYDELIEMARQAVITAKIKQGLDDVKAGRVQDAREAMHALAKKHDLRLDNDQRR